MTYNIVSDKRWIILDQQRTTLCLVLPHLEFSYEDIVFVYPASKMQCTCTCMAPTLEIGHPAEFNRALRVTGKAWDRG